MNVLKNTKLTFGDLFPKIAVEVFDIPVVRLQKLEKELFKQDVTIARRDAAVFVAFRLLIILLLKNDLEFPCLNTSLQELSRIAASCRNEEEVAVRLTSEVENIVKIFMGKPVKDASSVLEDADAYRKTLAKYSAHVKLWDGDPAENSSVLEFRKRFTLRDVT